MLLTGYVMEIFRAECNPSFESLHCIARLNEDISEVLPYLNAVLGGFSYVRHPPSVTFKVHGRLITVHGNRIAINALESEEQAERILNWLQGEINTAWENREGIEPSDQTPARPVLMEILKLLPKKAGCRGCGQPTCMVFAGMVAEGVKGPDDCPVLNEANRAELTAYLSGFVFEDAF